MKKKLIISTAIAFFLAFCFVTNPSMKAHKEAYLKFYKATETNTLYSYGVGVEVTDLLRSTGTKRTNFLFFSTSIDYKGNRGFGILGNVSISEK